ncbi:MAG: DUF4294 domain-containing protein [Bacteroidales bacterium]|nr:DUF4294 domain-containing protein [Bacteroidales bacterium]
MAVMIRKAVIFFFSLILLTSSFSSFGQNVKLTEKQKQAVMQFIVQGGDTLFVDQIPPAFIYSKGPKTGRDWVKYYKRVYNFAKAYPYSLFIAKTINETDSLFEAYGFTRAQKDRYLSRIKDALLANFKPLFKQLTLGQGLMMIRLVDREVGKTPYVIINDYLGGVNAVFWQGFARLFSGDLKQGYDKFGEDEDLEELVIYWELDSFDYLYEMIFNTPCPKIYIPQQFQEPFYKTLENDRYFNKILQEGVK